MLILLLIPILLISLGARGRYSSIWKNRSGVLTYSRGNVNISNGTLTAVTFSGALTASDMSDFGTSVLAYSQTTSASLLSTTMVALNANADTVLYTVPTGKQCVLIYAVLVVGANASTTDISIGQNGAEANFIPASDLGNLDNQYDSCILMPIPAVNVLKIESYTTGTVIEAQVTNQAGGASNMLYLYGTLY